MGEDEKEDSSSIGMAEIIAIVVCGIIIVAFIFACIVFARNAKKRQRMTAAKGVKEMSFDKIDKNSFAETRQINRDRTASSMHRPD